MLRFARGLAVPLGARSLSSVARDDVTRTLSKVKDEAKGQSLDLTEMGDATRSALKSLQDAAKRTEDDEKLKGKMHTLQASLKAYNSRVAKLHSEARSLHTDTEAVLRYVWGTDAPTETVEAEKVEAEKVEAEKVEAEPVSGDDFAADVPPVAQRLEEMNGHATVETVEAESVKDAPKAAERAVAEEEIEIEVEETSAVDDMPITDITKDLYARGIDFGDCKDASSLRRRYKDVLDGKFAKPEPPKPQRQQPPPPPPPSQPTYQQHQQQQSNTTETGLAADPHPNAFRKMLDPMKAVWEVKEELAKDNGIDKATVDLWSGSTKLEDHKRLYEYPGIQSNPIEVRSKGDAPKGPSY